MSKRAGGKDAGAPSPPGGFEDISVPHYHGHRDRLRARFQEDGGGSWQDYELLELLLFRSIPQKDVKPLAKELIRTFGSFAEVVAAPIRLLTEVKGIGASVALDLKVIEAASHRIARGAVANRSVLSSWAAVLDYCRSTMELKQEEHFRILFLDRKNMLIRDEVQQTGTVDHTPVYPREVVKRALELAASALILVHNHPSGNTEPSAADIRMTGELVDIARPLGLIIHDHVIVGRGSHFSFKAKGLI